MIKRTGMITGKQDTTTDTKISKTDNTTVNMTIWQNESG